MCHQDPVIRNVSNRVRAIHSAGIATAALIVAGFAGAANAQAVSGHLDLALALDRQGHCTFLWGGAPIAASGVAAAASRTFRQDVARQGGPRHVTDVRQVWVRGAANVPYRCLGGALRELQRGGAFLTRLILPTRSNDRELPFVVLELPQAIDEPPPPIEPVRNSITVTQEGAILWNEPQSDPFVPPPPPLPPPGGAIPGNGHGQQIDRATLRQYLDVVTQMQPMPETLLHPAPQSRLQDVEMVFVTARMANLRGIVLIGGDLRTGQLFRVYVRFSLAGEMGS